MPAQRDLAAVIRRQLASDPDLAAAVAAERFNLQVGATIYEARTAAGLTQRQLAERTGMRQSAIARLEDADYDGHSLRTLARIAAALGRRLEIAFAADAAGPQSQFTEEFSIEEPVWDDPAPSAHLEIKTTVA